MPSELPSRLERLLEREPLALARALAARGRWVEAVAELARLLGRRGAPAGSLLAEAQTELARRGWSAAARPGAARLECRGARGPVGGIELSFGLGDARDGVVSILPAVRSAARPARGASPEERLGLEDLAVRAGLLLESLRGQGDGGRVAVRAEAHEGRLGVESILRIGFACNQRCPFCFIPGRGPCDRAELERELDRLARRLGPGGELVISGGEPTADPALLELVEGARRRGLSRFVLQTNGVGLLRGGLLDRLVALGVRGYDVSFHSHRPRAYDRLAGTRGQQPAAVAALSALLARPECAVTACVLVNAWNYRLLPGQMGFLGRLARKSGRAPEAPLQIGLATLNGAGLEKAPRLGVSLDKVAPYLERTVERCRREGLRLQRFTGETALPACLLERPGEFSSELRFSQDRTRYAEDFSGTLGAVGRAKRPGCRACPYDATCLGVPAEYARMFGLSALRPPVDLGA